jgi:hypothetical protein
MIDRVTIETGSRQLRGTDFTGSGLMDLMGTVPLVMSSRIFLEEGMPGQVQRAPLKGRILNIALKSLSWMRFGGPNLVSVRAAGMGVLKK